MKLPGLSVLLAALALPLASLAPTDARAQAQAAAEAQTASAIPPEVAQTFPEIAGSDLPFDTDYRVGRLDNGMRYIIRSNATPPEQGMVQFWVDFGSVAEDEDEQGYAHFIEHMAFNGSTNVPEGEMLRLLEREGLAFGADTNASTGFDNTLYRLDLPRNDPQLLDTALMLMREVASEVLFEEEAVEREKGIILSERRVRDTYQFRTAVDNFAFLYPGSRISQRLPIGTTETIRAATGDSLRELYERYYRPDNTAIIVVGDYDADAVEAAIRDRFGDWRAPPRLPTPAFGPVDPDHAGETDIYIDPALPEEIRVSRIGEWLGQPDTEQTRRERVLRQIGYSIINRRLQRLSRSEDAPFRAARFGTSEFFEEGRVTDLAVIAAEGEWQRALAAAQAEYRRAMEFGFTEAEVAEQVANLRQAIESNAAGAATRRNAIFVAGALRLLRDDQVPTTPESGLERWRAQEPLITPDAVIKALRADVVELENPLIRYEGKAPPEGGAEALRAAWEAGMELPLDPHASNDSVEFAYTDFGEPGEVVQDETDNVLGIRRVRFANGVMLNLKQTRLEQDRVLVQMNIDGGDMLNTPDNPLATALVTSLPQGGLGAHTLDELQTIMAGRQVSLNVSSADETFRMSATTKPEDLELQLQLMTAALVDPGFRPTSEAQYYRGVQSWFDRLTATPSSALSAEAGRIISDGDPRFSLQPEEDYLQLTFARLREAIIDRWQNGAIELAIVGDIEEQTAIALVARTLGTLPPRETGFGDYAEARQRSFTTNRGSHTIYHDGQPDQAMLQMVWPTRSDEADEETLQLMLLERVVRIRLLDVIREELGQTYSPGVDSSASRTYLGFGTFEISAQVDTGQVDEARRDMIDAIRGLRDEPVDEDTLLRARQPLLESFANLLDRNAGWMSLVDRAQTERPWIDRFLAGEDIIRAVSPGDIQTLAQRYLDPEQRVEFVVLPRPGEEPAS